MDETLVDLLEGNRRHVPTVSGAFDDLQGGQRPSAVTVCCSDSRVLQDHLWGNDDPGRVFSCANIGNRVVQDTATGRVVSGDVLYPIAHTGTRTAIVVGHSGCGAVTATYDHITDGLDEPPGIAHCIDLLEPLLAPGIDDLPDDLDRAATINRLVEYNVDRQVAALVESPHVPGEVTVAGVVYDFQDVYSDRRGEVHLVNLDGERDPDAIRSRVPEAEDRVRRLWTY